MLLGWEKGMWARFLHFVVEKVLQKNKMYLCIYWFIKCFQVNRKGLWEFPIIYVVHGRLLNAFIMGAVLA